MSNMDTHGYLVRLYQTPKGLTKPAIFNEMEEHVCVSKGICLYKINKSKGM